MKSLFSKSLSRKKVAVIIASLLVFSVTLGFLISEGTKKTVALELDGKKKIIKTHAATVKDILTELDISIRSEDYLFPSASSKVTDQLKVVWDPAKQVEVMQDNKAAKVWTTANTVAEFLKQQKISVAEHDLVKPKPDALIKDNMKVSVKKAFPLTLVNGGKKQQVWSTSTTVADFLAKQKIKLNGMDRVEPKKEELVKKNAVVNVIRVEKVTDVVEEPVNFAVVTTRNESLSQGTEQVVTEGQNGLVSKQFEVVLENGKEVSRKLINEKTLKEKQDKVVAVGTKPVVQQVSRGAVSGGTEIWVSASAYTASCNGCSGITATGINLHANPGMKLIAVDPSVIPLGSKVYVEGYGYAIAGDTGSAIQGNRIDVFFSSLSEAYQWGRKQVKVTILN